MSVALEKHHVESTPDVCGGRPCIAGTRIRVEDIYVWHELLGQTADEIVRDFPQLKLADVHAALAYFYDHQDEMQRQMREADALAERLKAAAGPNLIERLRGGDANAASVPS